MTKPSVAIRLGTEGAETVRRDFRSIGEEGDAAANRAARAFDRASDDIESAIRRQAAAADKLAAIMPQSAVQMRVNDAVGTGSSMQEGSARVSAAAFRELIAEQDRYEAGAARLRAELNPLWAAQQRFNSEMAEARTLVSAGTLTLDEYCGKLRMEQAALDGVRNAHGGATAASGAMRAGLQQAGFQAQDFFVQMAGGTDAVRAFSLQAPQMIGSLQMMTTGAEKGQGKFAAFANLLGGPWGVALGIAIPVAGMLVEKLLEGNNALDEGVKKLKEEAEQTRLSARAKEIFTRSIEGQIEATRRLNEELNKQILSQRQLDVQRVSDAEDRLDTQRGQRPALVKQVADQQAVVDTYTRNLRNPAGLDPEAIATLTIAAGRAEERLKGLKARLSDLDVSIVKTQENIRLAQRAVIQGDVATATDARAAATKRYTDALAILDQQLKIGAGRATWVGPREGFQRDMRIEGVSAERYAQELRRITDAREAEFKKIDETARALRSGTAALTQFIMPVDGRVTSGFGARKAPTAGASTNHPAIDIAAPTGAAVKAPAMGVVEAIGYSESLGKYIVINHGGGTKTRYGHLSDNSIAGRGDTVQQGDLIGRVGNTGRSTGSHLDYQVLVNGRPVDPRKGQFRTDADGMAISSSERAARDAKRDAEERERREIADRRALNGWLADQPIGKAANDVLEQDGERLKKVSDFMAQQRQDTAAGTVLLNLEWEMRGRSRQEIEAALELRRYQLDIERQMPGITREQVEELVNAKKAQIDFSRELDESAARMDELNQFGGHLIDNVLDPSNWDNWGDVGKQVINDIMSEFIKLAAINPLKNAIFGGDLPTIGGDFLGGLLGGGKDAGAASLAPTGTYNSAVGTEYAPAGSMLVGENGPERVDLPRGARVLTASDTRRAMASNDNRPDGMTVNLGGVHFSGGVDLATKSEVARVADATYNAVLSAIREAKRRN